MRPPAHATAPYRFGPYHVDVAAGQLRKHGLRVRLAGQPFDVLVMLLERAGQVVTREELQQRLWAEETFVDFENSLNKAINKLRQALSDSAEQPTYIETLPRRGYRFIGTLEGTETQATTTQFPGAPAKERSAAEGASGEGGGAEAAVARKAKRPEGWRGVWTADWIRYALLATAAIACALLAAERWPRHHANQAVSSVAVLPLQYLSSEPGQEYFADGITDELITQLAKTGAFRVTSRTSSMQFRKTDKSLPAIAHELGVDALVEGTIERSGQRVRIRAELIQASTDQHLWADSYDGEISDLLALEDRVARDIVQQVAVNLRPAQQRPVLQTRAVNADAHLDYLRGRFYWNERTPEGLAKALKFFQAASEKDPQYAAAYAGLADTYVLQGGHFELSEQELIPKAKAAAQKALSIENLAEAHATLGLIAQNYDWDWKTAEREYRTAIALNPNYSTAHHWYGEGYLAAMGRFDEAVTEMKLASELDPLSPIIATDLGATYYLARRYDDAIRQLARTLELYPHYELAEIWLARAYEQKQQCPEALAVLAEPQPVTLYMSVERGRIYAQCGRQREAWEILGQAKKAALTEYVDPAIPADVYIGLRRNDEALTELEKCLQTHSTALTSLKVSPIYDPLRSDPRFTQLLRQVHFLP